MPMIPVRPDHLPRPGRDLLDSARHAAVEMLDGGDAGTHELERRIQRVQMEVDPASSHPVVGPELQRQVRRSELQRRQADMVVRVDEPREHDEVVATDDFRIVRRAKIANRADIHDRPVTNQHRRIVHADHVPVRADAAHDRSSLHDECLHVTFLLGSAPGSPTSRCAAARQRGLARGRRRRPRPDCRQSRVEHPSRVQEAAGSGFGRPQGARKGRAMDGAPRRGPRRRIRVLSRASVKYRSRKCCRVRLGYACRQAEPGVARRNRP